MTGQPEQQAHRRPGRRLTDRQAAILERIAAGRENKQIAAELGISEQAVKEQVSAMLRALAAPNRAALADSAAMLRLVGTTNLDPAWLQYLFLDSPLYIAVVEGPEHRFVATNEAYRAVTQGRDLIGHAYGEQMRPGRPETLALLDEARRTGAPVTRTAMARRFATAPGREPEDRYVSVVVQPLPRADDRAAGLAIFGLDVTDAVRARQRAETMEQEELALLDLLTTGVMIVDAQRNATRVNDALRRLISLPSVPTRVTAELLRTYDVRDAASGAPVAFDDLPPIAALRGTACRDPRLYRVRDPQLARDRLLRVSSLPLVANDGAVVGSVTTINGA